VLPQRHISFVSRDRRSMSAIVGFGSQPSIDALRNGVYFLLMIRSNGFVASIVPKELPYACPSGGVLVEFQ
jgi:hypothetical protein